MRRDEGDRHHATLTQCQEVPGIRAEEHPVARLGVVALLVLVLNVDGEGGAHTDLRL